MNKYRVIEHFVSVFQSSFCITSNMCLITQDISFLKIWDSKEGLDEYTHFLNFALKPVQIMGAQRSSKGPGTRLCCMCFYLSRQYHNFPTLKINPFTPSWSHSATKSQSFRRRNSYSVHPCWGGGSEKLFRRSLNPLSGSGNHSCVELQSLIGPLCMPPMNEY